MSRLIVWLLLLSMALFYGCKPVEVIDKNDSKNIPTINAMSYIKDPRTGICFARVPSNITWYSIASVPCTKEVEKLLINND